MNKYDSLGCLGWCIAIIGALVLIAAGIWLDVWLVYLMWSAFVVPVFGLPVLTMWQVFCMKILLWLLVPVRIITTKK